MKLLLLFLAFTLPTHADPLWADKTARTNQIERKYHMEFDAILRIHGVDYWVFMCADKEALFDHFPVVVLHDSDDHDVDVAIIAARNCASFYDAQFKPLPKPAASPKASPSATPASAFTVPVKPPEERL
jgi:hypothetical protein